MTSQGGVGKNRGLRLAVIPMLSLCLTTACQTSLVVHRASNHPSAISACGKEASNAGRWDVLPQPPLQPRANPALVTTADEVVVWGGEAPPDARPTYFRDGAAYSLENRRWHRLRASPLGPRAFAGAVLVPGGILVWGGLGPHGAYADGAFYDLSRDRWRTLPVGPLSPRYQPTLVWTGRDVIIWGGKPPTVEGEARALRNGARYDLTADAWEDISRSLIPVTRPVASQTVAWTGTGLLVWTTTATADYTTSVVSDLVEYRPADSSWHAIAQHGREPGLDGASVAWTGDHVLIWGGAPAARFGREGLNAGGLFDPVSGNWTQMSSGPLDDAASTATAWSGSDLVAIEEASLEAGAARYVVSHDRWEPITRCNGAAANGSAAVWAGRSMFFWVGYDRPQPPFASALIWTPG